MRFLRTFGIITGLVVVAAGAYAQVQDVPNLEGDKAMQAMSGSTIVTVGAYGPLVMYVGSDHTLDVFKKGQRTSERWSSKGGLFCFEHESHCAKVKVFGFQGTLDYDGNVFPFTIEKGNQVAVYAAKG
jgi:hypothetical protein